MKKITFSFGKNWKEYVKSIDEQNVKAAEDDITQWLGRENISGRCVLDIGSGSGIHSYCFYQLGAKNVFSFDYDIESVMATRVLWESAGQPQNWSTMQGSVLDKEFIASLPMADIVYSWGVLHHTGNMWSAIRNAAALVKEDGLFFISIYAKGPNYENHLALKQRYNDRRAIGKWLMVWSYIFRRVIWRRVKKLRNPFTWNERKSRGMTVYHDVVDWLGGLPYEVAHEQEITDFLSQLGFTLQKKLIKGEGACHRLLYKRSSIQ